MDQATMEQFFQLLDELVKTDGPYTLKRQQLLEHATNDDVVNLEEFASWFPLGP